MQGMTNTDSTLFRYQTGSPFFDTAGLLNPVTVEDDDFNYAFVPVDWGASPIDENPVLIAALSQRFEKQYGHRPTRIIGFRDRYSPAIQIDVTPGVIETTGRLIDYATFQGKTWARSGSDPSERGPIRVYYVSFTSKYFVDLPTLVDAQGFYFAHLDSADGIAGGAFVAMVNTDTGEQYAEPV